MLRTIGLPSDEPVGLAEPNLPVRAEVSGPGEAIREAMQGRDELRAIAAKQAALENDLRRRLPHGPALDERAHRRRGGKRPAAASASPARSTGRSNF